MPTWLDRYAFPLVEIFRKESGLDFEVPDAMKQMTTAALQKMGPSPSLDSPWRFEADLRPHFDRPLKREIRPATSVGKQRSGPFGTYGTIEPVDVAALGARFRTSGK